MIATEPVVEVTLAGGSDDDVKILEDEEGDDDASWEGGGSEEIGAECEDKEASGGNNEMGEGS